MLIAVQFWVGDIDTALNDPTVCPFKGIFVQATDSIRARTVMATVVTVLSIRAVIGFLASFLGGCGPLSEIAVSQIASGETPGFPTPWSGSRVRIYAPFSSSISGRP